MPELSQDDKVKIAIQILLDHADLQYDVARDNLNDGAMMEMSACLDEGLLFTRVANLLTNIYGL